jgi:predicted ATPase
LDSPVDYRLYHLEQDSNSLSGLAAQISENTFIHPLSNQNTQILNSIQNKLSGSQTLQKLSINVVKGRDMTILGCGKIARINFNEVFNGTYGASDFIAITKNFHAVFVEDVK